MLLLIDLGGNHSFSGNTEVCGNLLKDCEKFHMNYNFRLNLFRKIISIFAITLINHPVKFPMEMQKISFQHSERHSDYQTTDSLIDLLAITVI